MKLYLNGRHEELPGNEATLAELLARPEWSGRPVIVEHNGEIVAKSRYAEVRLSDGDVVELVHFVGGG